MSCLRMYTVPKKIIFYYPGEIVSVGLSGSEIRPFEMLTAFKAKGYDVFEITGSSFKRYRRFRELKRMGYTKFDYFYGENSTTPTLFNDRDHIPRHPLLELFVLRWVKKHKIPIGLFYRDIYWKFPSLMKGVPSYKRLALIAAYKVELFIYTYYSNVILVPSKQMGALLRINSSIRIEVLPPAVRTEKIFRSFNEERPLRILYVGGIDIKGLYDITPILELCRENMRLTICCRQSEWEKCYSYYKKYLDKCEVNVVHAYGRDLEALYSDADVFSLLRLENEYLKMCMPFKIFESIGHGLPVICYSGSAYADFVLNNGCGWVVNSKEEAGSVLESLSNNRHNLFLVQERTIEVAMKNHYTDRIESLDEIMYKTNKLR